MTNEEIMKNSINSFKVGLAKAQVRFNDKELAKFKKGLTKELDKLKTKTKGDWWIMDKQKLIELVNDLQADNDFNTDLESKKNIQLTIDKIKQGFNITQKELINESYYR